MYGDQLCSGKKYFYIFFSFFLENEKLLLPISRWHNIVVLLYCCRGSAIPSTRHQVPGRIFTTRHQQPNSYRIVSVLTVASVRRTRRKPQVVGKGTLGGPRARIILYLHSRQPFVGGVQPVIGDNSSARQLQYTAVPERTWNTRGKTNSSA